MVPVVAQVQGASVAAVAFIGRQAYVATGSRFDLSGTEQPVRVSAFAPGGIPAGVETIDAEQMLWTLGLQPQSDGGLWAAYTTVGEQLRTSFRLGNGQWSAPQVAAPAAREAVVSAPSLERAGSR